MTSAGLAVGAVLISAATFYLGYMLGRGVAVERLLTFLARAHQAGVLEGVVMRLAREAGVLPNE